jgi:hypothetical protein
MCLVDASDRIGEGGGRGREDDNMSFCNECAAKNYCEELGMRCRAYKAIYELCDEAVTSNKAELIRGYAKELDIIEYEVSHELQQLGESVVANMPELHIIRDYGVKIGYVISYYSKNKDGKSVFADCRKVTNTYTAFLPFDFIITFYDPNTYLLTDNQKKILMLHELKHIGMGPKGLRVEPHDIEDFAGILQNYGLNWNGYQVDVPDILAGGDDETGAQEKKNYKKENKNR